MGRIISAAGNWMWWGGGRTSKAGDGTLVSMYHLALNPFAGARKQNFLLKHLPQNIEKVSVPLS